MEFTCSDVTQTNVSAVREGGDPSFGPFKRLVGASGICQEFDDLISDRRR